MTTASRNYNQCTHLGISRLQAEDLLLNAKLDGSFLVRESESVKGAYTLCVLFERKVHQYRILPDGEGLLSIESEEGVRNKRYPELTSLIHDYVQRGTRNGLATSLMNPIYVEAPDIFSDDDLDSDVDERDEDFEARGGEIIKSCEQSSSVARAKHLGDLESFVHNYFLQRFTMLDLSSCDGSFIELLKRYVMNGASRDIYLHESSQEIPQATHLHALLEEEAQELIRQMEFFMKKIDLWRQLFGPITTTPLIKSQKAKTLFDFFDQMNLCRTAVTNLEKKADMKYRELVRMWKQGDVVVGDPGLPKDSTYSKPNIPCASFEVKVVSMSVQSRVVLTVDIMNGKLNMVKSSKESVSEKKVFTHDKIEQLVKSTSCNTKLDVKIAGMKKKTFIFEDARQCENFCQLVQQLKKRHSLDPDINYISLYTGTWNMGGEIPLYSLQSWLKSDGLGKKRNVTLGMIAHDVYVIATQESSLSDKEWCNRVLSILMESFGEEFYVVTTGNLWSIRTVVISKTKHKNKISNVEHSSVKTGIANALGNKGATGISFYFCGTSFCFINAHLTSGSEKVKRREHNFRDIIRTLDLGRKSSTDVTNRFHHVFLLGDLNYRIDGLYSLKIIELIKSSNGDYQHLLGFDQLKKIQQERRVFAGFKEEEISFPPTYRFQKGSRDRYVWQKYKTTGVRINVPSWCDRILWKSFPSTWIYNTSYGCCEHICSSDHKPLFGSFDVKIYHQFSSALDSSNSGLIISFHEVLAELKTSKQENFQLEISSACIEGSKHSKPNMMFMSKEGYICPKWDSNLLPELCPIIDDLDHLEEQHILLCVKNFETSESYGECVLALKSCFAKSPQPFLVSLTHLGEESGALKCCLRIKTKNEDDQRNFIQRKTSIDLVYMDTDFLMSATSCNSFIYEEVPTDVHKSTPTRSDSSHASDPSPFYSVVAKSGRNVNASSGEGTSDFPPIPPPRSPKGDNSKRGIGQRLSKGDLSALAKVEEGMSKNASNCGTVMEWLNAIGLRQYTQLFVLNGWDNVCFLQYLNDDELLKIGVTEYRHRRIILSSVGQSE